MFKLIFGQKINFENENTQFLTAPKQVVLQDIKSFEEAHLDAKMYSISFATL